MKKRPDSPNSVMSRQRSTMAVGGLRYQMNIITATLEKLVREPAPNERGQNFKENS